MEKINWIVIEWCESVTGSPWNGVSQRAEAHIPRIRTAVSLACGISSCNAVRRAWHKRLAEMAHQHHSPPSWENGFITSNQPRTTSDILWTWEDLHLHNSIFKILHNGRKSLSWVPIQRIVKARRERCEAHVKLFRSFENYHNESLAGVLFKKRDKPTDLLVSLFDCLSQGKMLILTTSSSMLKCRRNSGLLSNLTSKSDIGNLRVHICKVRRFLT